MAIVQGVSTGYPKPGKVPTFLYENIGFTIGGTTALELVVLDVLGIRHMSVVIENETAVKRMDLTTEFYLDEDSSYDVKSLLKSDADVAVAATSTTARIYGVSSHTRATDPDAAPAVVDALPSKWMRILVDSEDATVLTGNIWLVGGYQ